MFWYNLQQTPDRSYRLKQGPLFGRAMPPCQCPHPLHQGWPPVEPTAEEAAPVALVLHLQYDGK